MSYSLLTENLVLDPIKNARGRMAWDCCDVIDHEVSTRLIAVTLALPFALIDAGLCLGSGLVGHVIGIIDLCCNDDFTVLEMAGKFYLRFLGFLVMAVAGPILGIINPDFLEDIRRVFLPPLNNSSLNSPPPGGASGNYLSSGAGSGASAGVGYQVPASAPGSGLSAGVGYQAPSSGAGSGANAGAANQQQLPAHLAFTRVQPRVGAFGVANGLQGASDDVAADALVAVASLPPSELQSYLVLTDAIKGRPSLLGQFLHQRFCLMRQIELAGRASRVARDALANTVYRFTVPPAQQYMSAAQGDDNGLGGRQVKWLTDKEWEEELYRSNSTLRRIDAFSRGLPWYFHCTRDKDRFLGILRWRYVVRAQAGSFPGAFVSTQPEIGANGYGRFCFGFKRTIEFLNPLEYVSAVGLCYWVGFNANIPVNRDTVACIFVDNPDDGECAALEQECEGILGYKIPVRPFQDVQPHLNALRDTCGGVIIPNEWPNTRGPVPQLTIPADDPML